MLPEPPQRLDLYSDGAPLTFASNNFDRGVSASCPWRATIREAYAKLESAPHSVTTTQHCALPHSRRQKNIDRNATLYVLTVAVGTYDLASHYPCHPQFHAEVIKSYFSPRLQAPGILFNELLSCRVSGTGVSASSEKYPVRRTWPCRTQVKPEDTVLIYLYGHGLVPLGTEMFYFAPKDFDPSSPSSIRMTGFSAAMLSDTLRALPSKHIAVVLDACQSGAALTSLAKILEVKASSTTARDRKHETNGIFLLASATAFQEYGAAPPTRDAGLIAQVIASAALPGRGLSSRIVSLGELLELICAAIPTQMKQTPLIYSSGSDFPILEKSR